MKKQTMRIGKEFILDNKVDITEGSHDTTQKYYDGRTREEFYSERLNAVNSMLANFGAINKATVSDSDSADAISSIIEKERILRLSKKRLK